MSEKDYALSVESSDRISDAQLELYLTNPSGEPLTWGPPPLEHRADIFARQKEVQSTHDKYFTNKKYAPKWATPALRDFMYEAYLARRVRRDELNSSNYACRAKIDLDGMTPVELGMVYRAETGLASPAELLHVQRKLGVPTLALASFTHPWGNNIEKLDEQRRAINDAILMHNGVLLPGKRRLEVLTSDNLRTPADTRYLFMSRETDIATVYDDTTITERSTFALDLQLIDQDAAAEIRTVRYDDASWSDRVIAAGNLYDSVPGLLDSDNFKAAVPSSTTTIARNKRLETVLFTDDNIRKRQLEMAKRALQSRSASLI